MDVIEVKNVSMHFRMNKEKVDTLKEYFIKFFKKELEYKDFIALNNINLNIKKGEVWGIIGLNGSGKSTLLKIISGILKATIGSVNIKGTISPLIELGAGFNMDLTARENIFLNGSVLGHSKKQMEDFFDDIVDFSEMREFLDVPMKNYSSGMVARIAFAIATVTNPDILIVDEILSVGDHLFQQKSENRILDMMSGGTTVIIVSHSIDQIERLCEKVVWLEKGKIKMLDDANKVTNAYKNA